MNHKRTVFHAIVNTKRMLPEHWKLLLASRCGESGTGSVYVETNPCNLGTYLSVMDWEPYAHPAIMGDCRAYHAKHRFWLGKAELGVVSLDTLENETPVRLVDSHVTGFVEVVVPGARADDPEFTVLIVGTEGGRDVVYTFHPGAPIPPSRIQSSQVPARVKTVADVKALGFTHAKLG